MTKVAETENGSASVVTIAEACRRLQLSRTKVYGLMDSGKLPYARFGRARRIPVDVLSEFIRQHTTRGALACADVAIDG